MFVIYQPSCQGVTIVSPSPSVGGTPCRLSTSVTKIKIKAKIQSISNVLHLLSTPDSVPYAEPVLASLVVESLTEL